eukprot:13755471-Ditylum_brightwellii.AAC.1
MIEISTTWPSTNDTTNKNAKPEAIHQLGSSLKYFIAAMADTPDELFAFTKLNIKDGFWHLVVHPDNVWHFCYILSQNGTVEELK